MRGFNLLLVAVALSVCHVYGPQPCKLPIEMTFRAVAFNHPLSEFSYYRGVYESQNQRLAFKGGKAPDETKIWLIMLPKEKIVYEINTVTDTCHKLPFEKMPAVYFPKNAEFEGTHSFGGLDDSTDVDVWYQLDFTQAKTWVGVFTRRHCYPVTTYLNHRNESTTMYYSDVVENIYYPEWFIPPKSCREANSEASSKNSDL